SRDRRHEQTLKSAVGGVHLSNKGAEPIDVLAWPLPHFAAKAEVIPFRRNYQRPYIVAACFVDRVSQTLQELQIKSVVRRIGKNDAADRSLAFKANFLHDVLLRNRYIPIDIT